MVEVWRTGETERESDGSANYDGAELVDDKFGNTERIVVASSVASWAAGREIKFARNVSSISTNKG